MSQPPKAGRPGKKRRLSVYLDPDISLRLDDHADRREQSRSMIAEAAIVSFLSPDAEERREAAIVKRLDRIDRIIQRLERDIGITNEALAIFIRSWLTSTASLPETAQGAARAKGGERYDKFLEALGRRLAKGPRLRQEVPEDIRDEAGKLGL
ncbi:MULTISPECIES: CopG family transcriptional regulator [unclassified Nitrobacter]|uniref:CopG family transcriptional regulator n=1 Tax=unclassified Nitrobacter TaxID=2620411 RepID=UPI00092A527D|nr:MULTISPECIES: CopG family transcriptional regulator [unclassified Nitrobacter]MBN9147091.1 CopG family transcriptional regulator [Nitrobacter sp.]OJV02402.1 MAG: CopG family transcriptional regulator [Nitrobacter sp. 62-23]